MKFRWRLSTLLWLVALVAMFLAGVRLGEHREAARKVRPVIHNITLTAAESAEFEAKLKVYRAGKPLPAPDTRGTPP